MYYARTDTPALVEELGQSGYIFGDKTGMLTSNEMQFRSCSNVAGMRIWMEWMRMWGGQGCKGWVKSPPTSYAYFSRRCPAHRMR